MIGAPDMQLAASSAPRGAELRGAPNFRTTATVPVTTMKLHRILVLTILALAIAATAFAHGGHKHQFLGTVKAVQGDQLVVTTTDDKDVTFTLTGATTYTKGA